MQAVVVSEKPKKQRKAFYSRKLHELKMGMGVHLSKGLRKELGKRSLEARKEDKVKVMRGKFRGKEGKIVLVNRKKARVFIDGITRKKAGGKEVFVPFNPSNLLLTELFSKDKKRVKGKKTEKPQEKKEVSQDAGKKESKKEVKK